MKLYPTLKSLLVMPGNVMWVSNFFNIFMSGQYDDDLENCSFVSGRLLSRFRSKFLSEINIARGFTNSALKVVN